MPILRVLRPHAPEVTHVVAGARVTIGRRPTNTIQIVDSSISAHHAELVLVEGHYRLHDLDSTNLTFVDGHPVSDFHLHAACKLSFGTVACEFDPATPVAEFRPESEPSLTPAQMEKDVAFLRAENQELLNKIGLLQRQIDILSSARLVTGKTDGSPVDVGLLEMKRLREERDAAMYQNSGLKLELEKLREEVDAASQDRDAARRAHELLQGERALQRAETSREEQHTREEDKGATQRIIFPVPAGARE